MRYSERKLSSLKWVRHDSRNTGFTSVKFALQKLKFEDMDSVHFDILIDGGVYEGSSSLEEALDLFRSVDYSCLREYYGHTKTLQVTQGNTTIKLTEAKIDVPTIGVMLHFANGGEIATWRKMYPEEAGTLLQEEYRNGEKPIKVDVLNRDMEVVLEFE